MQARMRSPPPSFPQGVDCLSPRHVRRLSVAAPAAPAPAPSVGQPSLTAAPAPHRASTGHLSPPVGLFAAASQHGSLLPNTSPPPMHRSLQPPPRTQGIQRLASSALPLGVVAPGSPQMPPPQALPPQAPLSQAAPLAAPQASPQAPPQALPQALPQASPQAQFAPSAPEAAPQAASQVPAQAQVVFPFAAQRQGCAAVRAGTPGAAPASGWASPLRPAPSTARCWPSVASTGSWMAQGIDRAKSATSLSHTLPNSQPGMAPVTRIQRLSSTAAAPCLTTPRVTAAPVSMEPAQTQPSTSAPGVTRMTSCAPSCLEMFKLSGLEVDVDVEVVGETPAALAAEPSEEVDAAKHDALAPELSEMDVVKATPTDSIAEESGVGTQVTQDMLNSEDPNSPRWPVVETVDVQTVPKQEATTAIMRMGDAAGRMRIAMEGRQSEVASDASPQELTFSWLGWSPSIGSAVFEALHRSFPGALPARAMLQRSRLALAAYGVDPRCTPIGQFNYADDASGEKGSLLELVNDEWCSPVTPFVGRTGYKAFSNHVPEGGNSILLFGPQISISPSGEVGQPCRGEAGYGAIVEAYRQCCEVSAVEDPDDMQQNWLRAQIAPRVPLIQSTPNPMAALAMHAYEVVRDRLTAIADAGFSGSSLVLLGGVQLNLPDGFEDHFMPLAFELREMGQAVSVDLLSKFDCQQV